MASSSTGTKAKAKAAAFRNAVRGVVGHRMGHRMGDPGDPFDDPIDSTRLDLWLTQRSEHGDATAFDIWAVYMQLSHDYGDDLSRVQVTTAAKACIDRSGYTPLEFLAHLVRGWHQMHLYDASFVLNLVSVMYTQDPTDVCFLRSGQKSAGNGQGCWEKRDPTADIDCDALRAHMQGLESAVQSMVRDDALQVSALQKVIELTLCFFISELRFVIGRMSNKRVENYYSRNRSLAVAVQHACSFIQDNVDAIASILDAHSSTIILKELVRIISPTPDLSAFGKLVDFMLTFIGSMDPTVVAKHMGPSVTALRQLVAYDRPAEPATPNAGKQYRQGGAPSASGKPKAAPSSGNKKKNPLARVWQALFSHDTDIRENVAKCVQMLSDLRAATNRDKDPYTYREAKIRLLRNMRKTVENTLSFKEYVNQTTDAVRARCVQLHNNPRHLFTLTTWKTAMDDVMDFIESGDNERKIKELVLHKKFELYALNELADVLRTAVKIAKKMHQTILNLGKGSGTNDDVYEILNCYDRLVWLQQKTWQEHAHDSFYSAETVHELEATDAFAKTGLQALVTKQDKLATYGDAGAELQAQINAVEFGDLEAELEIFRVKDAIDADPKQFIQRLEQDASLQGFLGKALVDKIKASGKMAEDDVAQLMRDKLIIDAQSCHVTEAAPQLPQVDASAPGPLDMLDDHSLRELLTMMHMATGDANGDGKRAAPLSLVKQGGGSGGGQGGPDNQDKGAGSSSGKRGRGDGMTEGERTYAVGNLGSGNLQPLIQQQRDLVNLLSQTAKSTIEGAVRALALMNAAGNRAKVDTRAVSIIRQLLQGPLLKVADCFYRRIRKEPYYYQRPFGSDAAPGKVYKSDEVDTSVLFRGNAPTSAARVSWGQMVVWSLLELDTLVLYVLKALRLGTLLLSIYAAQKIFVQRYMSQVYADKADPPSLFRVLLLALSIDAFLQLILTLGLVIVSVVFKKSERDTFVLDDFMIYLSLKEYILTSALLMAVGLIVSHFMITKRYFNYRSDGIRVIRGFSDIMMGVGAVIAFLPCTKLTLS